MEKKKNILLICSDQHSIFQTGCYGNGKVITPNIDELARTGTRFEWAYSNNPICVPARACMATGQYSHCIGSYDNATPYTGQVKSFGHRLEENHVTVTTIGKLHYRKTEDDTGFKDQRIPLHIKNGIGDIYGLLRDGKSNKIEIHENLCKAGCAYGEYQNYDKNITKEALNYLDGKGDAQDAWMLYVGYTFPHPPFFAPEDTWKLYEDIMLPMPRQYKKDEIPKHEMYHINRSYYGYDIDMNDEQIQSAVRAYYAMCTFLDIQIGKVIKKLEELKLRDDTIIIYTSDHGEMLGEHGIWGKNCMFEQSVRIPMIFSGEGIPRNRVNQTLVSLVDIYPTLLDLAGVSLNEEEKQYPGKSLTGIMEREEREDRKIFSEYHATGSLSAEYMLRFSNYKYIYYVGMPPQLFDLKKDPYELKDLAGDAEYKDILQMMDAELKDIIDPEQLNQYVKQEQEKMLDLYGGRENVLNNWKPIIYSPAPVTQ